MRRCMIFKGKDGLLMINIIDPSQGIALALNLTINSTKSLRRLTSDANVGFGGKIQLEQVESCC